MPVKHLRFDLQGTLCGGAEKWSAGVSMTPQATGTPDVEAMTLSVLTLFNADFWDTTGVRNVMSPQVALTACHGASFTAAGVVDATAEVALTTPVAGTAGGASTMLPPQCSVVLSMRTPIPGPRGRGRMYLPGPCSLELTANGRLLPDIRDGWLTKLQTWINDLNAEPGLTTVGVASSVGGFVTAVSSIRLGDVVDTQRRRRDSLPEAYATGTITP